jgi:di/tricarboxylate transporter
MAFGAHLGGLTTLVGTPPNLVASNALIDAGHEGFSFFEFAPFGVPALIVGALFVAFVGRHLLPREMPASMRQSMEKAGPAMQFAHALEERQFRLKLGEDSPFAGRTLAQSELGAILGLGVYAVRRGDQKIMAVGGDFILASGDVLLVQGSVEGFQEFLRWKAFEMASGSEIVEVLASQRLLLVAAVIAKESDLVGLTVRESDFARRFGAHILAIRRDDRIVRRGFADFELRPGDRLQVELKKEEWEAFLKCGQFEEVELISDENLGMIYPDSDSLLQLDVEEGSGLAGISVREAGLSERLHLRVIGIARQGGSVIFPSADEKFQAGDKLLIHGMRERIELMRGIQSLELIRSDGEDQLLTEEDEGHVEVTLSPQGSVAGKTLRELNFRRRYGLEILSIWRQGRSFHSHLRNMTLEFGDALLLYGPRERINELSEESDFLILSQAAYDAPEKRRPPWWKPALATLIVLGVVALVLTGRLPIAVAAVAGSAIMIASRCLKVEEAYRAIDWKSVFLIACMLPLGAAMQSSGAATWLAKGMATAAEPLGPWGIIAGLYLLTMLATTIVPTAPLVVIMSSIAIDAAARFNIPPQMIIMSIAIAASASFSSPISHAANALVMGPGGYRFLDYVKIGLLLGLLIMITVLPLIALKWGWSFG